MGDTHSRVMRYHLSSSLSIIGYHLSSSSAIIYHLQYLPTSGTGRSSTYRGHWTSRSRDTPGRSPAHCIDVSRKGRRKEGREAQCVHSSLQIERGIERRTDTSARVVKHLSCSVMPIALCWLRDKQFPPCGISYYRETHIGRR